MKIFWISALAVLRPIYFIYSLSFLLLPLLILYTVFNQLSQLIFAYSFPPIAVFIQVLVGLSLVVFVVLVITTPILVYRRQTQDDAFLESGFNPFQSALMSWFSTLRWYWNDVPAPMARVGLPSGFLVENPTHYRLSGNDVRDVLSKLQPGDILLRAFDGYLDGVFIRRSSLCSKRDYRTGWFTHAGLYVGALNQEDQDKAPVEYKNDERYFQQGPQMVVHAMPIGVNTEDILTWIRCDYLAVLRIKSELTASHQLTVHQIPKQQPTQSDLISLQIKDSVQQNKAIDRDQVIQTAKLSALEKIGEPYDFEYVLSKKFNRFSCSEFVYFCFRSIPNVLGFAPRLHALYPLGRWGRFWHVSGRTTVTPDDFYDLAKENHFDIVWIDKISQQKI